MKTSLTSTQPRVFKTPRRLLITGVATLAFFSAVALYQPLLGKDSKPQIEVVSKTNTPNSSAPLTAPSNAQTNAPSNGPSTQASITSAIQSIKSTLLPDELPSYARFIFGTLEALLIVNFTILGVTTARWMPSIMKSLLKPTVKNSINWVNHREQPHLQTPKNHQLN